MKKRLFKVLSATLALSALFATTAFAATPTEEFQLETTLGQTNVTNRVVEIQPFASYNYSIRGETVYGHVNGWNGATYASSKNTCSRK